MSIDSDILMPAAEEIAAYFDCFPSNEHIKPKRESRMQLLSDSPEGKEDTDKMDKVGIDSPSVIAFADGVSKANREAVMWSVTWAEFAAKKKYDINESPIEWLDVYAEGLRQCGWAMTGGHEYSEYRTTDASLTMDSVVLELIASIAGANAATVIQLLSLALDKLQKNEPIMNLFERNSKKGNVGTFRVMPCVESSEGTPLTYLVSMHCTYSSESGGVLFWKWSVSKLDIKRLAKGVEFFRPRYDLAEPKIKDRLGTDLDDYFNSF